MRARRVAMRARLRALRSARSRRSLPESASQRATVFTAIAEACSDVTLGLEVCAKRSRNPIVAVRASELAAQGRALGEAIANERAGARPRTRMADRMRWEWLASTGSLLDAAPERRSVDECLRAFDPAIELACAFRGDLPFVGELVDLIRALEVLRASLALSLELAPS